jgi:serine/threonine-protein kinase
MKSQTISIIKSQKGQYPADNWQNHGKFYRISHSHDLTSGKAVIIQSLAPELSNHPSFPQWRQKFLQLGERLSQCSHSNLVPVLDVFQDQGIPYLVSEKILGVTLDELLKQEVIFANEKALKWIREIAEAVTVLHSQGLYHQGINPKSIIFSPLEEQVFLTNLALYTPLSNEINHILELIAEGYTASEQYQPYNLITAATDVYGLSATLYFLMTGRSPLAAPLRNKVPWLEWQQLSPHFPPVIKTALLKGLGIDPTIRPQTVDQWLALLPQPVIQATSEITQPPQPQPVISPKKPTRKFGFGKFVLITMAIAGALGMGFGFAIRFSLLPNSGGGILDNEQTFPPTEQWPISGDGL